jgi:NADH:ubiquinone oxidoreductase subunit K
MIPVEYYIIVSILLFSIGSAIVFTRRNILYVLMGIELIFNAANINLVAFGQFDHEINGQLFSMLIITVAAAESVVALAIVIVLFKKLNTVDLSEIKNLKEK